MSVRLHFERALSTFPSYHHLLLSFYSLGLLMSVQLNTKQFNKRLQSIYDSWTVSFCLQFLIKLHSMAMVKSVLAERGKKRGL